MIERLIISLIILAGLSLLWLVWQRYKRGLLQRIQPTEAAPGVPTLLYFSADYCAPCRLQQTPIVDYLAAKFGPSIAVKKYDVVEHPDLASRYKVLTLPTTVVLDRGGQVAHLNYGVTSQANLEAQLFASQ